MGYHYEMKNLIYTLGLFVFISCGMKETVVSNLDTIVYHKAQSKLDLYSNQKEALKEDIKKFLNGEQIRVEDTRNIVKSIHLRRKDEIPGIFKELISIYKEIALDFSGVIAKPLSLLDAKQQKFFFSALDDENQDMEKKLNEVDSKDYYKRFKFFFGDMNDKQEVLINSHHDFFKDMTRNRLEKRKVLHAEMRRIYGLSVSSTEKEKLIFAAFKSFQGTTLYKQDQLIAFIMKVLPTLDDKQIKYFDEKKADTLEMIGYFAKEKY